MAPRKAWADLSPGMQQRYARKGITPQMHASGVNLTAARGHGRDKLYMQVAKMPGSSFLEGLPRNEKIKAAAQIASHHDFYKLDGHHVLPGFDELKPEDQIRVAENWRLGFMTEGPHDKKRAAAREELLQWFDAYGPGFGKNEWKKYKDDYQTLFGGG